MLFLLLGLGSALLGAWLLARSVRERRAARARTTWPVVPGRILGARVAEEGQRDAEGNVDTVYTMHLQYAYRMEGRDLEGTRVVHGPAASWTTSAQRIAAWATRYPAGADVSVACNPADPSDAVLESGVGDSASWITVAIGVGLVLFGVFLAAG